MESSCCSTMKRYEETNFSGVEKMTWQFKKHKPWSIRKDKKILIMHRRSNARIKLMYLLFSLYFNYSVNTNVLSNVVSRRKKINFDFLTESINMIPNTLCNRN